jgi:hypothetical protein
MPCVSVCPKPNVSHTAEGPGWRQRHAVGGFCGGLAVGIKLRRCAFLRRAVMKRGPLRQPVQGDGQLHNGSVSEAGS